MTSCALWAPSAWMYFAIRLGWPAPRSDRAARRRRGGDVRRRIADLSRVADDIELATLFDVVALEAHISAATADVKHVALVHRISLAVHRHAAWRADVQHAQLAALEEVLRGQRRRRGKRQRVAARHRATEYDAVEIDVPQRDGVGLEQALDEEGVTELLGRERTRANRIGKELHECAFTAPSSRRRRAGCGRSRSCSPPTPGTPPRRRARSGYPSVAAGIRAVISAKRVASSRSRCVLSVEK